MNFLESFDKLDLPLYGVRCPTIEFTATQKKKIELSKDASNDDFLQALCQSGFKKIIPKLKEDGANIDLYKERTVKEFKVLQELGFVDYILMIWDVIDFCEKENIPTGPGRGSAASSLILYLIGVTKVDPIKYDLYFERFISATRAKKTIVDGIVYFDGSFLPDIDMDFCYYRRQEVIKYLEKRYPNRTAKILNTSTLSGRALIKDCGKIVGDKTEDEMNAVTSMIQSKFGKINEIDDEYKDNEDFKKWCDENKDIYDVAIQLKDLMRNKSVHASGNLVSYEDINNFCPTELTSDKERVSSYNKECAGKINLKLDILGLKSLSVVQDVCTQVGINYFDIDVEDYETVYAHLQDLKYPHGIFQIEAYTNYNVCKQVKPKNLDQLAAVVAIARPGALAFAEQYARYANYGEFPEFHPKVDEVLKRTGGAALYQEQMMAIGHKVFGLTLSEAETLRKIVGKKKREEMPKWKEIIYTKAKELKLGEEIADFYWKILEDSANYSFCAGHAYPYASLSAITTYLKFNYPKEFFLALLRMAVNESDFLEQSRLICHEMKAFGIELLPPHLAKSDVDFKIEGDNIRYGLSAIKGISEKTLKNVIAFRSNFTNKIECFDAAKEAKINIGALSAMIQAGALDGFGKSRSKLALEAQTYNILTDREKNMIRQMFANGETDILDNIKKLSDATDGDFIIKPSRFETIKKKYEPYKKIYLLNSRNEDLANFWYEYTLLGNPYSQSLNKIYREKNPSFNSIIDIKSKKEGDKVMVVGVVQEVTKRISQRGNKYVKVMISDETSEVAAMVFDSNRNKIQEMMDKNGGKLPEENDIVVISGAVKGPDAIYINDLGIQSNKIYCKLKDLKDSKETLEN